MTYWVGHLWQNKLLFLEAGLQGNTLSSHRMNTSFGPFELLTCGLLSDERAGLLSAYGPALGVGWIQTTYTTH